MMLAAACGANVQPVEGDADDARFVDEQPAYEPEPADEPEPVVEVDAGLGDDEPADEPELVVEVDAGTPAAGSGGAGGAGGLPDAAGAGGSAPVEAGAGGSPAAGSGGAGGSPVAGMGGAGGAAGAPAAGAGGSPAPEQPARFCQISAGQRLAGHKIGCDDESRMLYPTFVLRWRVPSSEAASGYATVGCANVAEHPCATGEQCRVVDTREGQPAQLGVCL
jgi:hypothetical protein